jgi:hypothetical protein
VSSKSGTANRDGLPAFFDQGAVNHQSSRNHEAESLFMIECARCMGKLIPEKGYRTADWSRLPARFGFCRFFIVVSE